MSGKNITICITSIFIRMQKLLFLFLFFPLLCIGKEYQVKLHVQNMPSESKPILLRIFNGNMYVVDSVPVVNQQTITFNVPESTDAGMLRAVLGSSPYAQFMNRQPTALDFLYTRENVEMTLDFNNPEASVEVIESDENRDYFSYMKKDNRYFMKLGSLEQVVTQYPDRDAFYNMALNYYKEYQIERDKWIDSCYNSRPGSLAARILNTRRMPFTEGNLTPQERDSIYREQFLSRVEFTDTLLLNTNIYTDKLFQYINFFMNREAGPRENEAVIIKVLDRIEPQISVNEEIRNNLLQFLISGFEAMKMEEVLAHISSNYLQQCGSSMDMVKRRLEGYKKMAIGQKVPDVVAMDINNNPVSLYSEVNPYTLLIFWHTGCSHCQILMNKLPEYIQKGLFRKHNVKILCISIDEKQEDWEKYSKEHPTQWTSAYVEGAFDSQAAIDFNLFATPSIFLLDNNNQIIAKPITPDELEESINALK